MFLRLVQLSINTEYESTFRQVYNIVVLPQLQRLVGCRMAGLIKSNTERGKFISLTLWDKKKQAEDYEKSEVSKKLSEHIEQFLSESSEWKLQLSEDSKVEYKPVLESPSRTNYVVAVRSHNNKSKLAESTGMYIRIVSVKIQPDKIKEFKKIYSKEILPNLETAEGCSFAYLTENLKNDSEFLSFSVWEDKSFADQYELSGKFTQLTDKVKHTFSKFYLWKMELEQSSKGKINTSEDMKIDNYTLITGKSFG